MDATDSDPIRINVRGSIYQVSSPIGSTAYLSVVDALSELFPPGTLSAVWDSRVPMSLETFHTQLDSVSSQDGEMSMYEYQMRRPKRPPMINERYGETVVWVSKDSFITIMHPFYSVRPVAAGIGFLLKTLIHVKDAATWIEYDTSPSNPILLEMESIDTQEDIDKMIEIADYFLTDYPEETVYAEIESTSRPMELLLSGWSYDEESDFYGRTGMQTELFLGGFTTEEIEFWCRRGISWSGRWNYTTMKKAMKYAVESADSSRLIVSAPDLLYSSKRPKTDMMIFRTPGSRVITLDRGSQTGTRDDAFSELEAEGWILTPVTRYAAGMSKGLYYQDPGEVCNVAGSATIGGSCYCGTFYYHEPESTTFLAYKTALTYKCKYEAYLDLHERWVRSDSAKLENTIRDITRLYKPEEIQTMQDYIDGKFPAGLMYTPLERFEMLRPELDFDEDDPEIEHLAEEAASLPQNRVYFPGHLYALEDKLDQLICKYAQLEGVDIIHLTEMVGSHQIVHEVLDVRDRTDSFKSLVFTHQS